MNRKIVISTILLAVVGVAGISFLVTSGIFHFRESLHVEGFQRSEEGAYAADILDSRGARVANIYVRVNPRLPTTERVPVMISIWHLEGTELDSLMLKISGQDFVIPVFLEAPGSSSWPEFHFHLSEDGRGVALDIEDLGLQGSGTVTLNFLLSPSSAQSSFQLEVSLSMHWEGILPLTRQEAWVIDTFPIPTETEIVCLIDGSPYVLTPVGSRSENFNWRCLRCGHTWVETYPEDVYQRWRQSFLEPAFVRDYTILYLRDTGHEGLPDPLKLEWTDGRETPAGLVGSETYVYRAEGIVVTIKYPVVLPENTIYEIRIEHQGVRVWEGRLHQRQFIPSVSTPLDRAVYDYYGGVGLFEEGIYVIATDKDPTADFATVNDYWRLLKDHATLKASTKDFISIVISRGDFPTGGYQIQLKSFAWLESYPVVFSFAANFTDPGEGVAVTEAFNNPMVLIPIGNLSAGKYIIEVHIDRFILTYDTSGKPIYTPIETPVEEVWRQHFEIS